MSHIIGKTYDITAETINKLVAELENLQSEYADACKWATDYENQVVDLKAKLHKERLESASNQGVFVRLEQKLLKYEGMTFSENQEIKRLREALEYYANPLPLREVTYENNYCNDFCPKDCNEHTFITNGKSRPACHSMSIAKKALSQKHTNICDKNGSEL